MYHTNLKINRMHYYSKEYIVTIFHMLNLSGVKNKMGLNED